MQVSIQFSGLSSSVRIILLLTPEMFIKNKNLKPAVDFKINK